MNRTGGGMRNQYGALFAQTEIFPLFEKMSAKALDFSPNLGSSISAGMDFIAVNETSLSVDEDLSTNSGATTYERDSQNSFLVESGSLYLQAQVIPGQLSFYLDETVAPGGASNREAFVLIESLPHQGYLKAGRMLLPYGLRVWDDETFVRQRTGFNFDNQDLGVEVGIEPGPWSLSLAVSNGTQGARDDNQGKMLSSVGALWLGKTVLGGSFALNQSRGTERLLAGPFASLRLGPLTWMGEVDLIQQSSGIDNDEFVAFTSVEYWFNSAVNFRASFDYVDPYDAIEEDEASRLTLGCDVFLTPFLSATAYYRMRESIPQDIRGNSDGISVGLHGFF
ncbi:MAG: hypothetical protein VX733_06075 [Candidatus Latescibacterota bacterium]|nr:hypothetical protein [Candidatus Latescibacterota bacterium]